MDFRLSTFALLLPLLMSFPLPTLAEEDPLFVKGQLSPYDWNPGQAGQLTLDLQLPPGFHAYEDQFKLTLFEPDGFTLGKWKIDKIIEFHDKFSKKQRRGIKGEARLQAPLEAPLRFAKDTQRLRLELVYQACSETYCLFPITKVVDLPLRLIGAPPALEVADSSALNPSVESWWFRLFDRSYLEGLLSSNLALALFLVFVAGIFTSFTPCIFPMIPITLAILGHHSEKRTRAQNFLLSLSYVHGIATTYAFLGLIAASSGTVFGASLGNPWVLAVLCTLFLLMALSMYGLFEIQVPAFIRNRLGSTKSSPGYLGAYLSGLIAGVVASPCVGPILVVILAWVATTQNLAYGFVVLFTYAMGMGLIFLVLGVFTELTRRLPRSGPWLEGTKFLLGSLMLGAFYYYLDLLIPLRWHDLALGVGLVILGSASGAFRPPSGSSLFKQIKKGFAQALLVIGFAYLTLGVFDLRPWLQGPRSSTQNLSLASNWQPYSEAELARAASEGRPVVIDFWAEWCAACHELEQITFVDERVQALLGRFTLLRFDATKDSEELRRLKVRWKIQGLPTVIFINPQGVWLDSLTLTEFEKPEPFARRLGKALN